MSGHIDASASGWTTDTLKHHVDQLIHMADQVHANIRAEVQQEHTSIRRENDDRDRLLTQIMDERERAMKEHIAQQLMAVRNQIEALDRLTDSKFVTFHTLVDAESARVALALSAADKAVSKAEVANETRFASVNEFRAQLGDQAATFMTRKEVEAIEQRNAERISDIQGRLDRSEGQRSGVTSTVAYGITAATITLSIVIFLVNFFFSS